MKRHVFLRVIGSSRVMFPADARAIAQERGGRE